jgi:two-component system NarL family sensor kinase
VPFADLDAEICSIAAFPLTVAAETRGVMMLLSDEPDYFSEERVPFLTAVAASIALTLENAYIFAQAWRDEHQLHLWAAQLINAQNVERRNLSYILHDETGESLTMLQMHLTALKNDLSVRSPGRAAATQAQQILGEIMLRLNQLAYALRPPELDILGLNAALATLCQEFTPQDGLSIRYSGVEKLPTLTEMAGVSFYHCLQEALTNVDRHAQASEVDVNLSYDQHFVYLQVKDNGIGLEAAKNTAVNSGIGLTDIKERFENIRGFMKIKSQPGRGTTLTVGIPRLDTI